MKLELLHISKQKDCILQDITAEFAEGIHGLFGPDMAAKKQLFRYIEALEKPEYGQVRFLEYDVMDLGIAYRNHLAYLGRYPLYPETFSVYHYLVHTSLLQRLTIQEARQKALHILRDFGMEEIRDYTLDRLPESVACRLNLMQTLLSEAPILLLEDPLRGLCDGDCHLTLNILGKYIDQKIILIAAKEEAPFKALPLVSYDLAAGVLTRV